MQNKIEFRKQRDFGETINDTFTFIKQNLKSLFKAYCTYCGFFVLATMLATVMLQLKVVHMLNGATTGTLYGNYNVQTLFSWEYFLSAIFSILSFTALQVTVVSYIKLYVDKGNEQPTREELWGYVKYYFLRAFGSTFLILLLLVAGTILCFFPGVWLFAVTALFFPIMISENTSFSYAFNRMFKLISNNWWVTFATLLVIWIIVYITMVFASLPTTILSMLEMFKPSGGSVSATFTILTTIIQSLCQVFLILPVVCSVLCYYNLVERKENAGLMDKIQNFGQKPGDAQTNPEEY